MEGKKEKEVNEMKQNRAEWDTLLSIEHGKNKLINQVFLIRLRRSRALLHRYAVVFLSHSRCRRRSCKEPPCTLSKPYDTDTILKRDVH